MNTKGREQVASPTALDPAALLRSPDYLKLLVFAAILGVPVSAAAYWFLYLVAHLQKWTYNASYLPKWLGFSHVPVWWPLLPLAIAGVLVGLTVRYSPGAGGHSPADGFKAGAGPPTPVQLPGIVLAALATLASGVVLGPEAPLIALGAGLAFCAVRIAAKDAPPRTTMVVAATGSFAAISALLGSPIVGAFFLMEASGLGGPTLSLVLVPGLLASGIGYLIFIGLGSWTGHGTYALAILNLPHVGPPTATEFLWAVAIGLIAAVLGTAIRWAGLVLRDRFDRRVVARTVVLAFVIGGLAIVFGQATSKSSSEVLFSGQSALPSLVTGASSWSVGALLLLVVCKSAAYGASLSSFRGGPTFPGMFIGAAGGIALSHLPGLREIPGAAVGIGAMCTVMLGLPITSVLLASVLMLSDGVVVMPLVIVGVVVAYVASARLARFLPASGRAAAMPRRTPERGHDEEAWPSQTEKTSAV